jgi:hypothetical protein
MEPSADSDLATLRAIARGAGLPDAEHMSPEQLVAALRDAGISEPTGKPVDTTGTGEAGSSHVYHGEGVGRRENLGGAGAETSPPE